MNPAAVLYLNFLRDTARAPVVELDPVEQRIVDVLALRWHSGEPVSVVGAMHMVPGISPSTAQRRMKSLRKRGVLDVVIDELDNRNKYLEPSAVLRRHLARMGRLMRDAALKEAA